MSFATAVIAKFAGLFLRVALVSLFFGGPVFAVSNLQTGSSGFSKNSGAGLVLLVSLQRNR